RVRQCIETGARGQIGVHGDGRFRVNQGDVRHHALADNGHLVAVWRIDNDAELRNIRRGAGSRWNADQRRPRYIDLIDTFESTDAAGIRIHDAYTLGAINDAATTDRDNDVAVFTGIEHSACHHLVVLWVWCQRTEND